MTTTTTKTSYHWFILTGIAAGVVHYVSAVGIEVAHLATPAWANFFGFMLAFPVSYYGHRNYSFDGGDLEHRQTLPRLILVSLYGFFAYQVLVLTLIEWLHWPFWFALGVTMGVVDISTFLLSRFWVFAK